jgi:hypothetical protein
MSRDYETDHEWTNAHLAQIRDALESIAVSLAKIADPPKVDPEDQRKLREMLEGARQRGTARMEINGVEVPAHLVERARRAQEKAARDAR